MAPQESVTGLGDRRPTLACRRVLSSPIRIHDRWDDKTNASRMSKISESLPSCCPELYGVKFSLETADCPIISISLGKTVGHPTPVLVFPFRLERCNQKSCY